MPDFGDDDGATVVRRTFPSKLGNGGQGLSRYDTILYYQTLLLGLKSSDYNRSLNFLDYGHGVRR
nr:hypothetical protein Itr_chr03CG15400 [Ipomoea trifida]